MILNEAQKPWEQFLRPLKRLTSRKPTPSHVSVASQPLEQPLELLERSTSALHTRGAIAVPTGTWISEKLRIARPEHRHLSVPNAMLCWSRCAGPCVEIVSDLMYPIVDTGGGNSKLRLCGCVAFILNTQGISCIKAIASLRGCFGPFRCRDRYPVGSSCG